MDSDPPKTATMDEVRIRLAFRRLQVALHRSGYVVEGNSLETVVTQVAKIVEANPKVW